MKYSPATSIAIAFFVLLTPGCSIFPESYQSVADSYSEKEYPDKSDKGYSAVKFWIPQDQVNREFPNTPTKEESEQSATDLQLCTDELSKNRRRFSTITMASEITQCMNNKGWVLVVLKSLKLRMQ